MRAKQLLFALFIGLALLVPSMVFAQFNMGGPSAKGMLIIMPDVQKELKMTGDQKKELQKTMTSMSADTMQMPSDMDAMNDEMDAKALAPLNADQLARLEELWIQYNGPKALVVKRVADKLQLSDDQRSKVKDIWDGYGQAMMDAMQHARAGSNMNGLKKKKKEAEDASLAVLTPDQAKAFADMQGKPFKFRQKNDF